MYEHYRILQEMRWFLESAADPTTPTHVLAERRLDLLDDIDAQLAALEATDTALGGVPIKSEAATSRWELMRTTNGGYSFVAKRTRGPGNDVVCLVLARNADPLNRTILRIDGVLGR